VHTLNDQQLKIGELPNLQILPIDQITFHEEPDDERSGKLIENLRKENKLKNPPVVATYGDNRHYILLDGANRITALRRLEIPDVLVQVIDLFDPGLIFLHWHHAVEHFSKNEFVNTLQKIPSLKINQLTDNNLQSNENGDLLCQIVFRDGSLYAVHAHADLFQRIEDLKQITGLYKGSYYMDRVSYTNLAHLKQNYANFCALIVFREFTKEELVQLTRINVPLDILRFDVSVDQKNHWLQKRINEQISDKSIRFYHEPTFLFDE